MHHTEISIAEPRIIEHHRTALRHRAHIPRLLLQLPDRSLLRRLAGIDEACRDFDDDFVDGRAELFLQQDLGACGFVEDCYYSDAVYV
jgi:hypothetical protein